MKLFLRVTGYLAVAVASAAITVVIMLAFLVVKSVDFPPPFQDLPREASEATVQEIVENAFPAGMPEKEMIAILSGWGFDFLYNAGRLRAHYPGWSCSEMFSISWTSDTAGRVSQVATSFVPNC